MNPKLLLLLASAIAFPLASCAPSTPRYLRPEAPDVHCDPRCETACADVPPVPVAEDGSAAEEHLVIALLYADSGLDQCDQARGLCVACIRRARDAGAIK